jgi:hypothetical protein
MSENSVGEPKTILGRPGAQAKEAKLRELAGKRVPAALEKIRLVGNLASYDPTPDQATRIVGALRAAVKRVEDRLRGAVDEEPKGFEL